MKTLTRRLSENEQEAGEVRSLQRALDQSYAHLRERAQAEWQRRCAGRDPSDACVRIRIGQDARQQALTF
jgi:hypothetical protein